MSNSAAQPRRSTRELLAGGRVKGGIVAAHIGLATSGRKPEDVERFWSALPAPLREKLQGLLLPVKWYDFADLIAVDRAIAEVYGQSNPAILREVGAHSARLNFGGVYKVYRRESIHEFLETGARFHSQMMDFGEAAYVKTGTSSAQMIHSDYSSYSPLFCESGLGFYLEAVRLHGARDVQGNETFCQCRGDKSCTFDLRWR